MPIITKEELVFLWLVTFGYKARVGVKDTDSISSMLGTHCELVEISDFMEFKSPLHNISVLSLMKVHEAEGGYLWHLPDEWFDEVLGVHHGNNH